MPSTQKANSGPSECLPVAESAVTRCAGASTVKQMCYSSPRHMTTEQVMSSSLARLIISAPAFSCQHTASLSATRVPHPQSPKNTRPAKPHTNPFLLLALPY
jgi:hypothetical protein